MPSLPQRYAVSATALFLPLPPAVINAPVCYALPPRRADAEALCCCGAICRQPRRAAAVEIDVRRLPVSKIKQIPITRQTDATGQRDAPKPPPSPSKCFLPKMDTRRAQLDYFQ